MKTLLSLSVRVVLLNFLANTFFTLVSYFLEKNEISIKGLSLFFFLAGIVIFIISIQRFGDGYFYRLDHTVYLTSLSILFLNILTLLFSLFLNEYIDPYLRFETAHLSATRFYEHIQKIEREQNVTFLFNYDEEVQRIVSSFEPINIIKTKLLSTLVSLVLYNFLILIATSRKSD